MNPRIMTTLLAALLATPLLGGCLSAEELSKDTTTKQSAIVFDSPEAYAAIQVATLDLCPTGFNATLDFAAPNDVFGLAVTLTAGQPATLAVSGPPALDTLLFVYGPDDGTGFYGALPIATDDDSGEGLLSVLADLEVPTTGSYFVVVTSAGGQGAGKFTLNGSSAACGPPPVCTSDVDCQSSDPCKIAQCDAAIGQCTYLFPPGGCGFPDMDGDGVADDEDNCPATPNPGQEDANGDGLGDVCEGPVCTSDNDCDSGDPCSIGSCVAGSCQFNAPPGCGFQDTDGDGVPDDADNCPATPNPGQEDTNGDGIGDVCEGPVCTSDNDCDSGDPCSIGSCVAGGCQFNAPPGCGFQDTDGDGVPDDADNCPATPNPGQEDANGDGVGDACEGPTTCVTDADCDSGDPCSIGTCVSGICEFLAPPGCGFQDTDGDGVADEEDNCPATPNPGQEDTNGNGMGDACEGPVTCETDADCDSGDPCSIGTCVSGICEFLAPPGCGFQDTDGDGVPDEADNCPATPNPGQEDADGDGMGDACVGNP